MTGIGAMEMQERAMPILAHDRSVIVKVRAVGVCGSDLHIYHGKHAFAQYPIVPGHEVVGEVWQVGSKVERLSPGNRVVLEPIHYCGQCYACKKGQPNVCRDLYVVGAHGDGGCQEYFMEDEGNWHKIPHGVAWHQAVMIEPYTIGAQVNARGRVGALDTVLIHGAGPAGLIALDVAKERGARVVVSEIAPKRMELAKLFGADLVIDARVADPGEAAMRFTEGLGPTVVIDAAGLPRVFSQAVDLLSPAGTIVSMSFSDTPDSVVMSRITLKELNIVGSRLQNAQFGPVIAGIEKRLSLIDRMITHRFPPERAREAIEIAASPGAEVGKVIIEFP